MAQRLGVSTATVSNVIHGKTSEVSEETIKKVQKMLDECNYVPNINARNLASSSSKMIGVGMINRKRGFDDYLQDPFMGELVDSITRALKANGYYIMLYFSHDAKELVQTVTSWNVDGLILFNVHQEDMSTIRAFKKPVAYIDSYLGSMQLPGIQINLSDRKGGYLMTQYLLSQGHRKIAFVTTNMNDCDFERYSGFVEALSEAGIGVDESNLILLDSDGEEIPMELEQEFERTKDCTAYFATSDYLARHVINGLYDRGLRVPEDVSVAGFDDNIYSRMGRPRITTVHQNVSQKGELAVEYILKQIRGETVDRNWIILPVELNVKDSVKCLKE